MSGQTFGAASRARGDGGSIAVPSGRAEPRWYAVHTQPHRELRALSHLQAQSFLSFLPLHAKTIRHARRLLDVKRPFFPRYLFVSLNLAADQWRSVNGTFGVARLVMDGDLPQPLPRGIVESLMAATDENGLIDFGPRLVVGETVRLVSGPFADLAGELLRVDESGRVRILLDLLGTKRAVHARANAVVPVTK